MQHGLEAAQVALREPGQRPVLEVGEVLVDPGRGPCASAGQAHGEGQAVLGPHVAADVAARLQPIQVAGQRGSLVGERAVEIGDLLPAREVLARVERAPGLRKKADELARKFLPDPPDADARDAAAASAAEFILEGLHVHNKLNKNARPGVMSYKR